MTPEDEEFARIDAEIKRRQPVPVKTYHDFEPLPVAPKPWVGLTDNEIALINTDYPNPQGFARAIEAKLKEKNT